MKTVKCDICGSSNHQMLPVDKNRLEKRLQDTYNLVRCQGCGLIFVDPQPSAEELKSFYQSDMKEIPSSDLKRFNEKLTKFNHPAYKLVLQECKGYKMGLPEGSFVKKLFASILKLFMLKEIIPFHGEGKILDVGCGSGLYLYMLKTLGWNTYGVEIDSSACRIGQKLGINTFCGTLEDTHYPSSYFDVVRLSHVLEHFSSPTKTFQEVERVLKDDGIIYIIVPNQKSFTLKIFGEIWNNFPFHLYIFSPHTLSCLCKKFNFRINRFRFKPSKSIFLTRFRQWSEGKNRFILKFVSFLTKNRIFRDLLVGPFCSFWSLVRCGDHFEARISKN